MLQQPINYTAVINDTTVHPETLALEGHNGIPDRIQQMNTSKHK